MIHQLIGGIILFIGFIMLIKGNEDAGDEWSIFGSIAVMTMGMCLILSKVIE